MRQQAAASDLHLSVVSDAISRCGTGQDAVIPILLELQGAFGYLTIEAMQQAMEETDITADQIYGVAVFYAQFRLELRGEHVVRVCHGTSCHVRGIVGIMEAICDLLDLDGEGATAAGEFTLEKVACLGCYSLSPFMMIADKVLGELTRKKAKRILKRFEQEGADQ